MNTLDQKNRFSLPVLFFLLAAAFCYGNTADQHLAIQNKRLEELDKLVAKQKKQIRQSFNFAVQSLQNRQADCIHQMEKVAYKLPFVRKQVLVELIESYTYLLPNDTRLLIDKHFSTKTELFSNHKHVGYKLIPVLHKPVSKPGSFLNRTVYQFVNDIAYLQEKLIKLEITKDTSLNQLSEWEKIQREKISEVTGKINIPTEKTDTGVIQAISYQKENPFIMINDKIVYQGQSIGNIKVLRISPNEAEFKMQDKTWVQNIDQHPNDHWQKMKE